MKQPIPRSRVLAWSASALLMVLLVLWAAVLSWTEPDREATAARKRMFAVAKVTQVLADNASPDTWTEGRRLGEQLLELEVRSGPYKGRTFQTVNYLSAYSNVDAKVGTRVIIRLDLDDAGEPYVLSIPNYDRAIVLGGAAILFMVLLVVIGGRKGVMALVGLAYTLAAVWFILVPSILRGSNPILLTVVIAALTALASLLLLTGWSKKTLCAVLGCVGGVAAAGLLAAVAGRLTPLNGFNMGEAEELVLRAGDRPMEISGLFVSGVLIAALGAVMDVAMSIASACWELRQRSPSLSRRELLRSGMNIGRDAMGTMANTLILAFAGASFNLLLLFQIFDYPMIQIFNLDAMAIEVLRGLAGSMGILLTVPLVAALSAMLMPPETA